jgi:hypothetical protein
VFSKVFVFDMSVIAIEPVALGRQWIDWTFVLTKTVCALANRSFRCYSLFTLSRAPVFFELEAGEQFELNPTWTNSQPNRTTNMSTTEIFSKRFQLKVEQFGRAVEWITIDSQPTPQYGDTFGSETQFRLTGYATSDGVVCRDGELVESYNEISEPMCHSTPGSTCDSTPCCLGLSCLLIGTDQSKRCAVQFVATATENDNENPGGGGNNSIPRDTRATITGLILALLAVVALVGLVAVALHRRRKEHEVSKPTLQIDVDMNMEPYDDRWDLSRLESRVTSQLSARTSTDTSTRSSMPACKLEPIQAALLSSWLVACYKYEWRCYCLLALLQTSISRS